MNKTETEIEKRIPKTIQDILSTFNSSGFSSFIVGGSVRDLLLSKEPKDWDIATNAKPKQIQELFPDSFYENNFGTVGIKTDIGVVEATTFRKDAKYSDNRRPDSVVFSDSIYIDLARRDFTINAIAIKADGSIIDPHSGIKDIEDKTIRAVGDANARFSEDALRMVRAVRFRACLGFFIEEGTKKAIVSNKDILSKVAKERIGKEMRLLFESDSSYMGIEAMKEMGLLEKILPEVAKGVGVSQNKHHIYDVYEHNLYSLKWADENKYSFCVKVAALLHDVAKPQTKRGAGKASTFYGHDVVGARMARAICERFGWGAAICEKVAILIRFHMFYYDVGEVTERSVRRLISKVGIENMGDLVKLRICDRMGSGVEKAEPYRLRHFQFLIEKVQKDPVTVGMLNINGNEIMKKLSLLPSPRIGYILAALLEEVLDNPGLNNKEYLLKKSQSLNFLSDEDLARLKELSKEKEDSANRDEALKIKKKYYVK